VQVFITTAPMSVMLAAIAVIVPVIVGMLGSVPGAFVGCSSAKSNSLKKAG
jgi:hypothetical protein